MGGGEPDRLREVTLALEALVRRVARRYGVSWT